MIKEISFSYLSGNAMFSGQIAFYADNCVADERLVTEYEKLAALVSFVVGETV